MPSVRLLTSAALSVTTAAAVGVGAITGALPMHGIRLSAKNSAAAATPAPTASASETASDAAGFATMGTTGPSSVPSASPAPTSAGGGGTGTRGSHLTVSGLPTASGVPAVVAPTIIVPSFQAPWPAASQWTFTEQVPGVTLGPVQHFVATSASGEVTLPNGPGEPHLLCAGPTNPLAAYSLDGGSGQWVVRRYDAGTRFDFYYRWVRGYYLQKAPCS